MITPTRNNVFHVSLRHPLAGKPFTVTMTDAECDAYAASQAPEGWHLDGPAIQGRNNAGERILITTYLRNGTKRESFTSIPQALVTLVRAS